MESNAFRLAWYNEMKDRVPHGEPYVYWDESWQDYYVEVDMQEDIFVEVSKELGWMV